MTEAVNKPFCGKIRRGRDRQDPGVLALKQPLGAGSDAIQRIANDGKIIPTRLGDEKSLALAIEELDGKLCLECLDLVADSALRDAELFRGASKTLVPGRGFERLQGIERWQAGTHREVSSDRS
jgi:hypothetical protein